MYLMLSSVRKKLIFISILNKYYYSFYFNKSSFVRNIDSFIFSNLLTDNLFLSLLF